MPNNWQCTPVQFSSVTQSCLTLCDPINCSLPGFPVHHHLPELAQTHVHRVSDGSGTEQPLYLPIMLQRSTIRSADWCDLSGRAVSSGAPGLPVCCSLPVWLLPVDIKLQLSVDYSLSLNEHCLYMWVEIGCLNYFASSYLFFYACSSWGKIFWPTKAQSQACMTVLHYQMEVGMKETGLEQGWGKSSLCEGSSSHVHGSNSYITFLSPIKTVLWDIKRPPKADSCGHLVSIWGYL